jgi:hypothetical protein
LAQPKASTVPTAVLEVLDAAVVVADLVTQGIEHTGRMI